MRTRELSNDPWAVEQRNKYRNDPNFRESEKQRARAKYEKKPKYEKHDIEGSVYITAKLFCSITGLKKDLLYRLIRDKVVIPHKRIKSSRKYLFLESDAYLYRDFADRFLESPQLNTIERYNLRELKQFLWKNSGKYLPETQTFLEQ